MQAIHSTLDVLRDRWAPIKHKSTFRSTGQITPEEFVQAGDYLVYKFPSWSWSSAATPAKAVSYLPVDKQYLVTRGVPCHRRLDDNFAGGEERVVKGGEDFDADDDAEGWLSTGGGGTGHTSAKVGDVKALGEKGEVENEAENEEYEEEIPDMEDEVDDEAIIQDHQQGRDSSPLRTYTLYITYTPYYRTPRLYLSGYTRPNPSSPSLPLAPTQMLEDIVGDYKDKTVTLEDFPFFDTPVKTASVHPCKHAAVMKVLLDRADAALKLRREKNRIAAVAAASGATKPSADDYYNRDGHTRPWKTDSPPKRGGEAPAETGGKAATATGAGAGTTGSASGEEWEEILQPDASSEEDEAAIRVDQYVVVFLKFMASVTPGIEHDFTMGV